ncbi:MAG: hypothetical protein L0Z55_00415 [Planctomycetes bacterium]|nr:hypothetical protein [Planctomycetota bacterium]
MRGIAIAVIAGFVTTVFLSLLLADRRSFATDGDGSGKRPLDLPSGGAGDDGGEEDAPEVIQFWGTEYEGEAFFWLMDRSGSMLWDGKMEILKAEMKDAIAQLSARTEFGMVSFADNFTLFKHDPVKATVSNRLAATYWIEGMVALGWTCMAPAAVETIELSNKCQKRHKTIIFVGDGVPMCDYVDTTAQVLNDIAVANYKHTKISTVYISSDQFGIDLFTEIAETYGGTFTNVPLSGD